MRVEILQRRMRIPNEDEYEALGRPTHKLAYVREVLPRNHGLPGYEWDFVKHEGPDRMRLRDHGNEIVVGLQLLHALEVERGGERASAWREPLARMLESADED